MAKAQTVSFNEFWVQVGNGAVEEVFAAPCGITSKAFDQEATVEETVVPDCDNPDEPAFVERAVSTISGELSGEGVLDVNALNSVWNPWFKGKGSRNCRIYITGPNGPYYQGKFVLTNLKCGAARGQKVNLSVTMKSDGEYGLIDPV